MGNGMHKERQMMLSTFFRMRSRCATAFLNVAGPTGAILRHLELPHIPTGEVRSPGAWRGAQA